MPVDPRDIQDLSRTGQVSSLEDLYKLVDDFEKMLLKHGVKIRLGSELEKTCLAVTNVLGQHKDARLRAPMTDIRPIFTQVLGFWLFLAKIVRLGNHPNFKQFTPHLEYLNEGTVVQNTQIGASEEATNKIFELLFALCMLDIGTDVVLDPPDGAKGDNPDIMVTLEGKRWGFACKTVYGRSGKAIFDNLKKGVEQIERADVDVGCVLFNFRNFLDPQVYWPVLNLKAFEAKTEAPDYPAYENPGKAIGPRIQKVIREKRRAVIKEIKKKPLLAIFRKKKAIPAFLAFAQTATGMDFRGRQYPVSIITLNAAYFRWWRHPYKPLFRRINFALHERPNDAGIENSFHGFARWKVGLTVCAFVVLIALIWWKAKH